MTVFDAILTRRSIRHYSKKEVPSEDIEKILQAAIFAPSGKNGQPWRFRIVRDQAIINELAQQSVRNKWMRMADCIVVVFLNKERSYDYIKDVQSCGAAMQDMLLTAHSLNIGCCWIGEVLDYPQKVMETLEIENENLELMGIITLGYSMQREPILRKKKLEDYLV